MTTKKLQKDTAVFQEGDTADVAYFIVSGKIELVQSDHGKTQVIKTLGAGDVFGEQAVFDPNALRPYQARVVEETDVEIVTPDEIQAVHAALPKPVQALLTLAFDKMKLVKNKSVSMQNAAVNSGIKKIIVAPAGDKMKALHKTMEVTPNRLPFRIGGYPEGGEANRRDTLNLAVASQVNPLRVSRQHCEITFEDNNLVITDLGSRFNTTVNDVIIGRGRGNYTAKLSMGKNTLVLGSADGNYTFTVTCE